MRARMMLPLLVGLGCAAAWSDSEQDQARAAVQRGEIRPLVQLIPLIEADLAGQLVEIELERRGVRWVYEAEVLTAAGERVERDYDAATGEALGKAQSEQEDDNAEDED